MGPQQGSNEMQPEIEIETKVLDINQEQLERVLQKANATRAYNTLMTIISYDFFGTPNLESAPPNIQSVVQTAHQFYQNNGSLGANNAHLRLRTFTHTDKIEFTFKHNIAQANERQLKQAHEYNAYLLQPEHDYLKNHLRQLGLTTNAIHQKRRTSWQLAGGCVCDIDTYPGIPTFAELEGSEAQIDQAIEQLGLTTHSTTQDSGAHFFAQYNQEFYSKLLFSEYRHG